MASDIDELLEDLRTREVFRRDYKTDCAFLERRAVFEADCLVRWIAAVEELVKRTEWFDEQTARYKLISADVDRVFNDGDQTE